MNVRFADPRPRSFVTTLRRRPAATLFLCSMLALTGCSSSRMAGGEWRGSAAVPVRPPAGERRYQLDGAHGPAVDHAIDRYIERQRTEPAPAPRRWTRATWLDDQPAESTDFLLSTTGDDTRLAFVDQPQSAPTQDSGPRRDPRAGRDGRTAPPGYWRPNLLRQAGGELKELITDDLWMGFKSTFWDVENMIALTGTLGASIAIREGGVDGAVNRRTVGEFKLGDADETFQILGNPGAHFAGAGVAWLATAMMQDMKHHEFSKTLVQALCVNGVTTMALKVSCNTYTPDGEGLGWPSGHTSSVFTVAAVVNEYYGPWIGIPSLAVAGVAGYQRLDSRVHDFSDVVFGAVLGYVVGTSIARDEKAEFPELFGMRILPYSDPHTRAAGLVLWKSW